MVEKSRINNNLVLRLVFVTFAMFGFGFVLVPLYDVFCAVTGIGGKVDLEQSAQINPEEVDQSRLVTIQFSTNTAKDMNWEFEAKKRRIKVHPGEVKVVNFYLKNVWENAPQNRFSQKTCFTE